MEKIRGFWNKIFFNVLIIPTWNQNNRVLQKCCKPLSKLHFLCNSSKCILQDSLTKRLIKYNKEMLNGD